jgi:hypothetical protein
VKAESFTIDTWRADLDSERRSSGTDKLEERALR